MGGSEELQEAIKELRRASDKLASVFQLSPLPQPTIMEPQSHSQGKEEEGLRSEIHSKVITQLEFAAHGKKNRSRFFISSAEIFARWDKRLCTWCDEQYVPGHKCTKMDPNTLFVIVAEEEGTMLYDFGAENSPLMDAPQVFDKSPGPNLDEGKQQGNAQPSSDENSGLYVREEISEGANSEMCMDEELHMPAEDSKELGLKYLFEEQGTVVPAQKDIKLLADWIAKKQGWKEANGFCEFVFDPGIIGTRHHLPQSKPLVLMFAWLAEIMVAFTLSMVRFVFDPGEKIVITMSSSEPCLEAMVFGLSKFHENSSGGGPKEEPFSDHVHSSEAATRWSLLKLVYDQDTRSAQMPLNCNFKVLRKITVPCYDDLRLAEACVDSLLPKDPASVKIHSNGMLRLHIVEVSPEQKDVEEEQLQYSFYTAGRKELLEARTFIAKFFIPRASQWLQRARRKREDPDEDEDAEIGWALKQAGSEVLDCSEIGDNCPLSGCSFSKDGKLLATCSLSGVGKIWSLPHVKVSALKGHTKRATDIRFSAVHDHVLGISFSSNGCHLTTGDDEWFTAHLKTEIMAMLEDLRQDDHDFDVRFDDYCAAIGKLLEPQNCVAHMLPVSHTIHDLEAVRAVFDPGGKIISSYIGPSCTELGHMLTVDALGTVAAESMAIPVRELRWKGYKAVLCLLVLTYGGLAAILVAFTLAVVRVVFDPGSSNGSTEMDVVKTHPQKATAAGMEGDNKGVDESAQVDSKENKMEALAQEASEASEGVLAINCLYSLSNVQKLRVIEWNSRQLLLKAQLLSLSCTVLGSSVHTANRGSTAGHCNETVEERFCCLYSIATVRHMLWKSAVLLACAVLWRLLFCLQQEVCVAAVITTLVTSMGSSSVIDEEQYFWHFSGPANMFQMEEKESQVAIRARELGKEGYYRHGSKASFLHLGSLRTSFSKGKALIRVNSKGTWLARRDEGAKKEAIGVCYEGADSAESGGPHFWWGC